MVILEIDNSHVYIKNLDSKYKKDLNFTLSYPIPGAHFSRLPWYLKRKWLLKEKNEVFHFPTGLLSIVLDFLKDNKLEYSFIDKRLTPESQGKFRTLDRNSLSLRSYQKNILDQCLLAHRGIVEAATGTGKTRTIIELVKTLSLHTLIVVPSTQILHQFYDLLVTTFGKKLVGRVGDGKNDYKAMITVASVQSLLKAPDQFWDKIQVLIIDEFHHSAADTYQELNNKKFTNIYYRFGFTGTNFRNDGTDLALQGVLSNVIYSYTAIDAINDGFLCPPVFCLYNIHHNVPNDPISTWMKEYEAFISNNPNFNQAVSSIACRMVKQGIPTIVFVKEIEHGQNISALIPGSVFINGEKPSKDNKDALEAFNKGELKCIVGTSVIGEGVDTVRAACGIMAGGGKAKSEVIQKIGRLLRPHPDKKFAMVVDFMHHNTKWISKHSKLREKIYKEYQCEIMYDDLLL